MKSVIDKSSHYSWGNGCDAWELLNNKNLTVKYENMPPGASEEKHFHRKAQQFFFIVKGTATFEIIGENAPAEIESNIVNEKEGMHIPAGTVHRIINKTGCEIEFLVISQPAIEKDKVNL